MNENEFVRKDQTATLWENDYKSTETHPDYKGDLKVDGKEYKISGWINESKNGKNYIGITVTSLEEHEKMVAKMKEKNENEGVSSSNSKEDTSLPF